MKSRPVLSCNTPRWDDRLRDLLKAQIEVDVMDFDYSECGKVCESLAKQFSMEMMLDRNPGARALHFRRPDRSDLRPER